MSYTFNPFTGNLDVTPFSLDGAGKIPSNYLPSYVDDVVEYDDLAGFPGTGETGKIYVAKDTGYTYRWTGSVYVRIGSGGEVELNLGSEGSPSLFFNGDANTGLYSPGANQLAISTNGTGRLFVDASGRVGIGGTGIGASVFTARAATNQNITIKSSSGEVALEAINDANNANVPLRYLASQYVFNTGASERLRITSAGLVGIGTSAPNFPLHLVTSGNSGLAVYAGTSSANQIYLGNTAGESVVGTLSNQNFGIVANGGQKVTVTTGGNVGIGTTSPAEKLDIIVGSILGFSIGDDPTDSTKLALRSYQGSTNNNVRSISYIGSDHRFQVGAVTGTTASEAVRIDNNGRLLVGTSSITGIPATLNVIGGNNTVLHTQGANADSPFLFLSHARGTGTQSVNAQDGVGAIAFVGYDGTNALTAARIEAFVDGTPGANDMPGRLVFSTTANGASSSTERMRIKADGYVNIGTGDTSIIWNQTSVTGVTLGETGVIQATRSADTVMLLNRLSNDGDLVVFAQAGTVEGSIGVSGSTVSYNGAHLSRWSQLPGGVARIEILRGSVLSNLDEMCEWGDEDNEQLNRMKVSDVEGDKNVSGVFQAWDDDDDTYTNDFYCAMTGDFVIRIAQGVTVERGDLLMSAGDGTAKPQDDDIIRSKTIAKVTSTHVSETYADGSYCVPCVLMAC